MPTSALFRPLPPTSAHFRLPCPPSVLAGAASPSPGVQSLSDHISSDQMLTYHPQLLPPHPGNGFSVTLVPVRPTIPSWLPFPAPNSSLMLSKPLWSIPPASCGTCTQRGGSPLLTECTRTASCHCNTKAENEGVRRRNVYVVYVGLWACCAPPLPSRFQSHGPQRGCHLSHVGPPAVPVPVLCMYPKNTC